MITLEGNQTDKWDASDAAGTGGNPPRPDDEGRAKAVLDARQRFQRANLGLWQEWRKPASKARIIATARHVLPQLVSEATVIPGASPKAKAFAESEASLVSKGELLDERWCEELLSSADHASLGGTYPGRAGEPCPLYA